MKYIIMILLLCAVSYSQSDVFYSDTQFECESRNGWAIGYGRYSYEGEYSSYWGKYAKAGEYVLFVYPRGRKVYWFRSYKCNEL